MVVVADGVGLGVGVGVGVGEGAIVTGMVFGASRRRGPAVGGAVGDEGWSPAVSMLVGTPAPVGAAPRSTRDRSAPVAPSATA